MSYSHYDRLSALDASFLGLEDANVPHAHRLGRRSSTPGRCGPRDGGIDIERVRAPDRRPRSTRCRASGSGSPRAAASASGLGGRRRASTSTTTCATRPAAPRRRAAAQAAGRAHHVAAARPRASRSGRCGSSRASRAAASRMITKVASLHDRRRRQRRADGVGDAVDTRAGSERSPSAPPRWLPRPAPTPAQLLAERGSAPRRAGRSTCCARGGAGAARDRARTLRRARRRASTGVGEALGAGCSPASPTPLNFDIGPHRRFDWLDCDLGALKDVKQPPRWHA